jgi:ubiquinone biosynthesis protein UbiJ
MSEQIIAQFLEEIKQLVARVEALEKKVDHCEKFVNKFEEHEKHLTDFRTI